MADILPCDAVLLGLAVSQSAKIRGEIFELSGVREL